MTYSNKDTMSHLIIIRRSAILTRHSLSRLIASVWHQTRQSGGAGIALPFANDVDTGSRIQRICSVTLPTTNGSSPK